jgi:hypothetical protein
MSEIEKIEEIDHLRKKLAETELARAKLAFERAQLQVASAHATMAKKYAWCEGDMYDENTLVIKRAPRLEALKAKPKR